MSIDWPTVFQGSRIVLDPLAKSSWPIAIGLITFNFRDAIRNLLGRMKKLNTFGNEAEFGPQEIGAQQAIGELATPSGTAVALSGLSNTDLPPQSDVYDLLDQEALEILNRDGSRTVENKLRWAVRMRSVSEANRRHETNYRNMYGSQIKALKHLHIVQRALAEDFRPFFREAAENPDWRSVYYEKSFEQWGQFVLDTGYVRQSSDIAQASVEITPFGNQFLEWMLFARASEARAG